MGSKLVIVESPAKARTIERFLGGGYTVKASVGHIRDLPKSSFGVDEEHGYEPQYEVLPEKRKVVAELERAARQAEAVYVATDPDREGEAICWHLKEVLAGTGRPLHRVEFHEITRRAVREAMERPRDVDLARVDAQQARRVIDRVMGYRLSPLLWEKVKRGLSAGRVQSVALKMICDREDEIEAFEPEEYWVVEASVHGPQPPPFVLKLAKRGGKAWRPGSEEEARAVEEALRAAPLTVAGVRRRTSRSRPKPPFITSHLQQEAARRLNLPVRRTMRIAQSLYEGVDLGQRGRVGLITYMRTDSVRVAEEAVAAVRELIGQRWGGEALPARPNVHRSRAGAQEAHEAIRPTDVRLDPDTVAPYLDRDQLRLYRLIWERFVASQMKPAVYDVTQVTVQAGPYTLAATGRVLRDPGYLRVWREEGQDEGETALPPGLEEGVPLQLERVRLEQKFTQPPPRYTEATLVKALEENGIGRPSTYATILATLSTRDYVVREKRTFRPTTLGRLVNRLLTSSFGELINERYTASLEAELDRIAAGEEPWREVVRRFAERFYRDLERARREMEQVKGRGLPTGERCPECGRELTLKFGRYGEFLACSGYPECRFTRDVGDRGTEEDAAGGGQAPSCPECEAPMVQKRSRYGPFWACTRYPECRGRRRIGGGPRQEPRPTGVACPREECDGELMERRSRRGRVFYGCSRYPDCDATVWDPPVASPCPACGHPVRGLKVTKRRGRELVCPVKECGHREPAPEEAAGT